MKKFLCCVAICALSACGGSRDGLPASSPNAQTTPPARLSLSPANWSATLYEGDSLVLTVNARSATPLPDTAYVAIVQTGAALTADRVVALQPDGSYAITLHTAAALAFGHITGVAQLRICRDSGCGAELAGSPLAFSYDFDVRASSNLSNLVRWSGVSDWETFQANAAHTGYVPVNLDPKRFSLRWRWSAPAQDTAPVSISTLVVADGRVFAAAGNRLYARKEFDGSAIWIHDFAGLAHPATNPPAVVAGMVYIVAGQSDSSFLFGLNAENGIVSFNTAISSQWEHYLAPTVSAGMVYTDGGYFGGLYAFNAITGQLVWFAQRAQTALWTPAVQDGKVYTFTDTLEVAGAGTGILEKSIAGTPYKTTDSEMHSAPVLSPAGLAFCLNAGRANNALFSFSTQTGLLSWSVPGHYSGNPAYSQGRLYALAQSPFALEARAEADGTLLWKWSPTAPGETAFVGDVLLTNNLAFVSTDTTTHAIDLLTHKEAWQFPKSGTLALSAYGVLYIVSGETVIAVNVK